MAVSTPVVLLVEVASGDTVAVRFPSSDEAMDWADRYGILELGRPPIVSRAEARRLLKGDNK